MAHCKRIGTLFVVSVLACACAWAGVTGAVGSLKTAGTEHFDIIYEPESAQTAAYIYDNCEQIYDDLVQLFGEDPHLSLPVVVTSQFKVLNAYYTMYTGNHIVMFDTVSSIGSLSNFPETMLYIFRHELAHAFQFNLRGPFYEALSKVFGDIVSISPLLYLLPSLSEGGAVLAESTSGYGRLNDSYSMQIVRQAKIEGLFPTWLEVSGARDTYPSGLLYYNFAACFLQYLAEEYGYEAVMSLYSDFGYPGWFDTLDSLIRDHIGITVDQAWQHFQDWVEVPKDLADTSAVPSRLKGGRYCSLVTGPYGSLYAYDAASGSVLRFSSDLGSCDEVLYNPTSDAELSVSSSGYVLIPYINSEQSRVKLYHMSGDSFKLMHTFRSFDRDYRSGCIVALDGMEYALLYSSSGQNTSLELFDLQKYEVVEGKSVDLGYGVTAGSFVSLGGNRVAFIGNYASYERIAILDLSDMSVALVDNPDEISIMSLSRASGSETEEVLCFAWYPSDASSASMGRYGELSVSDTCCEMRLSLTDVSGGMQSPVRMGTSVVFAAEYFDSINLRTISYEALEFADPVVLGSTAMADVIVPYSPSSEALEAVSEKYKAGKYYGDGILVPVVAFMSGGRYLDDAGLGATWLTMDPTETYSHLATAGYSLTGPFMQYEFSSSNLVPYTAYASAAFFTTDGILVPYGPSGLPSGAPVMVPAFSTCLEAGLSTSLSYRFAHAGETLTLSDSASVFYGFGKDFSRLEWNNLTRLTFGFSRSTGMRRYDSFGFSASLYLDRTDPGASVCVSLPRLIWGLDCTGRWTYNIPAEFGLDVSLRKDHGLVVQPSVDLTLLGCEINGSIRFLSLYVQHSDVDLYYNASLVSGPDAGASGVLFANKLGLSWTLSMSPVLGAALTRTRFTLGLSLETDFITCPRLGLAYGVSL